MSWLILLSFVLIMGKLSVASEDPEELDTGQPLNYKKVHKVVNQTNREIVTRTIIKPVSYSYITADVNPSAPASANKLTAVHVQRDESTIAEGDPEEDIQIIEESQIRPSHHNQQVPNYPVQNAPAQHIKYPDNPAPATKHEKPVNKPVLIRHRVQKKIIETNRPHKIYYRKEIFQPILVKKQVTYPTPKLQIIPNQVIAVKRPEDVRRRPPPPPPPRPPPSFPRPQPKRAKNPPQPKPPRPVNGNNDIIATNENRPRQKSVKFPLNTVLPGNSIHFDDEQYENLAPAVNAFSDLNPSRSPKEGLVVSHNAVKTPQSSKTHTTITNHGHRDPSGNYPLREYTATTHNNRGKNGDEFAHTEHLRVRGGNGDLSGSASGGLRSEQHKHGGGGGGGGGGGKHHESSGGSDHHSDYHSDKGEKGEKGYKKKHKHNKSEKGHHDKENHSGEYEEKGGHEKKNHESDGYYGEHHEGEKGEKGKKYGEGAKHKKGHSTHGEHNIVKKDEYVKSTKFYDENHDGGEHEEQGKYYGHHEEKKGGHKKGGHHSSDHHKQEKAKKGHHDKGHEDEKHSGHEESEGHDDHYAHEEEYGSKKGGESSKKWGKSSGKE